MNIVQINARLREAYRQSWPVMERVVSSPGVSGPLLIKAPQGYGVAKKHLVIVGQQTNGWSNIRDDDKGDPIEYLMNDYEGFALGKNPEGKDWTKYPFFLAAHELHKKINPEGPELGFVWTNLVRVDQTCERPTPEIEEAACGCGLLEKELSFLEPDIVIFLTGPTYDERLMKTFPGISFEQMSEGVFVHRLLHHQLPKTSFRTYHPKYLSFSKQWNILDILSKMVS